MILHKESLTDIHAQLRPDGLNGCVNLLLVTDQSNAKLYKLIEAQSCNLEICQCYTPDTVKDRL